MFSLALVSCTLGQRMETGWFPQKGMRVAQAEELMVDTAQAELEASFSVEQGQLAHQGD